MVCFSNENRSILNYSGNVSPRSSPAKDDGDGSDLDDGGCGRDPDRRVDTALSGHLWRGGGDGLCRPRWLCPAWPGGSGGLGRRTRWGGLWSRRRLWRCLPPLPLLLFLLLRLQWLLRRLLGPEQGRLGLGRTADGL